MLTRGEGISWLEEYKVGKRERGSNIIFHVIFVLWEEYKIGKRERESNIIFPVLLGLLEEYRVGGKMEGDGNFGEENHRFKKNGDGEEYFLSCRELYTPVIIC